MATVKHVVLDSGAFLRNAPVRDIAENVYTVTDVVDEIKDRATKQRLQVLPYELVYREPSAEAIKRVTEFSKKTGDYRNLSAVDLKVMALAYQLEKEFVGTDHIKLEPDKKIVWDSSNRPLQKATEIAGFYVKPKVPVSSRTTSECSNVNSEHVALRADDVPETVDVDTNTDDVKVENTSPSDNDTEMLTSNNDVKDNTNDSECVNDLERSADKDTENENDRKYKLDTYQEGDIIPDDCIGEETDSDDDDDDNDNDDDDDDDDDDGGGWITPGNIKSIKENMNGGNIEKSDVLVGCLTTDFAMQNVLIQMGLNVISVDGMVIKRAKNFVLRCFACFKITTNMEKTFCAQCGNKTLTKVSMTVNEDGSIKYFLSRRKQFNTRGTKFKLPMPKGGKHAENPILVEDQPLAQNRVPNKARQKMQIFDADYVANTSPFAINDVTSRAAQLGIRSHKGKTNNWERRNPNTNRKNKRKK
ncbi:Nin1 binding protein [Mactra antiquata]